MAVTVTLLGVNYSIPEPGDTGYDQALTSYLKAIATSFPQVSGGTYALTAELDFGASFGLKSLYYKSATASPATAGAVRLARADVIDWRNAANTADLPLAVDASNNLTFNANYVTGNPVLSADSAAGQSITTGSTESIVIFGTTQIDSDTGYNIGTGRFTVPTGKGGDYVVHAQIAYNTAPGGTCTCSIYRNAVALRTTQAIAPGAQQTIAVSEVFRFTAGDIIDIRTKHGNVGSQALQASSAANFVCLKRITN